MLTEKNMQVALVPTLAELQYDHIKRTLDLTGGNKAEAAKLLGIDRRTLYRMLARAAGGGVKVERGMQTVVNQPVRYLYRYFKDELKTAPILKETASFVWAEIGGHVEKLDKRLTKGWAKWKASEPEARQEAILRAREEIKFAEEEIVTLQGHIREHMDILAALHLVDNKAVS